MRALLVVLLVMFSFATDAKARSPALWVHNGSLMDMRRTAPDGFVIRYYQPRDGMQDEGVVAGTILFAGTIAQTNASYRIEGTAYVFDRLCGAIPYQVGGTGEIGDTIELAGPAPIVTDRCDILGYNPASPNARLIFFFVGPADN